MLLLSASPERVPLTPEALLRLGLLPCLACGQRGPHRLIGHRGGGFVAACGACATPSRSDR